MGPHPPTRDNTHKMMKTITLVHLSQCRSDLQWWSIVAFTLIALATDAMPDDGLYRRQNAVVADPPPPACANSCAFVARANACDASVCACQVWASTGGGVAICVACVQPINNTLAIAYQSQQMGCQDALISMSISYTVTIPFSSIGIAPSVV